MNKNDLPSLSLADTDLLCWKDKWSHVDQSKRPDSLAKALKKCDHASTDSFQIYLLYNRLRAP